VSMILVDGSALYYRSHFAFARRPLTAPSGETTSVAFGFFNSLLRLVDSYDPNYLIVVFDRKGKVFRHEMYSEYKAQRKPMPEELSDQLPLLYELLGAWGVTVCSAENYEADDVIATLAKRSADVADKVWLYSGDKDFMQLLDSRTSMLKPGKRGDPPSAYTDDDVRRDYKLEPQELIDVFALAGDASDNIPGAPGIGQKTALKLIHHFGSLDNLLDNLNADRLTKRQSILLEENRDQVLLSRKLFTIVDEVPVDLEWEACRTTLPTNPEVRTMLENLGLRQVVALADRLAAQKGSAPPQDTVAVPEVDRWDIAARGYRILNDDSSIQEWIDALPDDAPLAVDTETDSLRADQARLVGLSLAAPGAPSVYIPVLTRVGDAQGSLFQGEGETSRLDAVCRLVAPLLADTRHEKVGQNLKYDEWILTRHGMPLAGKRFDTMIAAYVLDPGRQRFGLDALALEFLGHQMIPFKDMFEPGDRTKDILSVPLEKLGLYAAEDADATLRLRDRFAADLKDLPELESLFQNLEMPVSEALFRMERHGIRVDAGILDHLHGKFASEMIDLEKQCHEAAETEFNVQSPKQLATILFDSIGLKPIKKTSSGWSTDVSVLEALRDQHPLPGLILEHRQLAKLQGTYVEALKNLMHPDSGLIHTSYNQAVAATGRLSSSDPNLQNIPIRSENGRLIRSSFVPRKPDHVFVSADYSQVELRLLAHLAEDERLITIFNEGGDVHRRTAALINEVDEDQVTSEMRSRAKAINFGVIYGMGARALSKQIGVKMREATAFIDSYFRTYPGVQAYIDQCQQTARDTGETSTLLGRRRLLPDITSDNNRERSFQERIAVNTPIQGTAADLIKLAMLEVDRRLTDQGLKSLMLLQVHDELLLEVPKSELETVKVLLRESMEGVMELSVPLVVDVHVGTDWAGAHG
jgi:DNA polymerase I